MRPRVICINFALQSINCRRCQVAQGIMGYARLEEHYMFCIKIEPAKRVYSSIRFCVQAHIKLASLQGISQSLYGLFSLGIKPSYMQCFTVTACQANKWNLLTPLFSIRETKIARLRDIS